MKDVLPLQVFTDLAKYLRHAGNGVHKRFETNAAAEDSLTGAAFVALETFRSRRVWTPDGDWRWRVVARKFGSGGRSSLERRTGADGIIELEIQLTSGVILRKGVLIQAKKLWRGTDERLLGQINDMENLAPGGSIALDYSPGAYIAVPASAVIAAKGNRKEIPSAVQLSFGDFLADQFLTCLVGLRGMHVEPRRLQVHFGRSARKADALRLVVPNRLRIEVEQQG